MKPPNINRIPIPNAHGLRRAQSSRAAVGILTALLCLTMPIVSHAAPTTQPSTTAAMQKRLLALQARIDELSARQQATQARNEAVMRQISNDADQHSQLMSANIASAGNVSAGYEPDTGFFLQSDDGNFSLRPGLLLQTRYDVNYRNQILPGRGGVTGKQGDDTENGFEITRFRLSLAGNVVSPLLTYYIQVAQDSSMPHMTLLDAYAMYRVSAQSPIAIKIGQFKDPVWHEQNLLESHLMAVDRSLLSALVGGGELDRVQGAAIIYDQDRLRGQLVLHDGYDGLNEPFTGPSGLGTAVNAGAGLAPTNWGASARAEYLAIGDRNPIFNPFSEYDQFTARNDKQNILVGGGGFDYSESGANKLIYHTVDAQFNTTNGWAFYAAYLGAYRNLYTNRGIKPGSYYDSGVLVQASYLLTPTIEPFIRYDYTHLDGDAQPGIIQDNIDEITIGANYYLFGQQAKFTVDGSWLPNGSPADVSYLDILQDSSHNEWLFRAQFQLAL
jgi:hypothetical protein